MGIRKVAGNPLFIAGIVIVSTLTLLSILYSSMPTLNVVESGSMQHSDTWQPGVINTGDVVFERNVSHPVRDVVTYVEGRTTNFSTYGDYGNVILYRVNDNLSIIHRAMFYLTWNDSTPVVLGYQGQSWINISAYGVTITDVGYAHRNLYVPVFQLLNQSGFITMGDANLANAAVNGSINSSYMAVDQTLFGFPPISPANVTGVAFGQIPWAGLIKLNIMKSQGDWPYYDDVPRYSYLYLTLSFIGITSGLFLSLYELVRVETRRYRRGN